MIRIKCVFSFNLLTTIWTLFTHVDHGGVWFHNLRIAKPVLYQLSYGPIYQYNNFFGSFIKSNLVPLEYIIFLLWPWLDLNQCGRHTFGAQSPLCNVSVTPSVALVTRTSTTCFNLACIHGHIKYLLFSDERSWLCKDFWVKWIHLHQSFSSYGVIPYGA